VLRLPKIVATLRPRRSTAGLIADSAMYFDDPDRRVYLIFRGSALAGYLDP
jgi:hypothetical protein